LYAQPETLATLGTQDKDKPETLATLGTQHTRQRQTKHKNTITQKTKMMSDTDTTQNIKIKINRMTSFDRYSNEY
jgi:hypothetical protein